MTRFTKILAASALAFAVVSPALAEEQAVLKERNVYLFMNGKMASTTATEATHAMAMNYMLYPKSRVLDCPNRLKL